MIQSRVATTTLPANISGAASTEGVAAGCRHQRRAAIPPCRHGRPARRRAAHGSECVQGRQSLCRADRAQSHRFRRPFPSRRLPDQRSPLRRVRVQDAGRGRRRRWFHTLCTPSVVRTMAGEITRGDRRSRSHRADMVALDRERTHSVCPHANLESFSEKRYGRAMPVYHERTTVCASNPLSHLRQACSPQS
jgi:hypothetical protein